MKDILREKLVESIQSPIPELVRRDIVTPAIKNKAIAAIGMRRSGKSSFLWQCLDDRVKSGLPRESQIFLNFEDERLDGITALDLG